MTWDELPEMLKWQHVAAYMQVGRTEAYAIMGKAGAFPVGTGNGCLRLPKELLWAYREACRGKQQTPHYSGAQTLPTGGPGCTEAGGGSSSRPSAQIEKRRSLLPQGFRELMQTLGASSPKKRSRTRS